MSNGLVSGSAGGEQSEEVSARVAVRIARGVKSRLVEGPGGAVLQVQGASDAQAAWAGLVAAAERLQGFDADRWAPADPDAPDPNTPNYVSDPMPAATGPFVMVDAKTWPERALRRLPELVSEDLEAAGVADAVIAVPEEGGPLTDAFVASKGPRAVTAALLPPVGDLQPGAPRGELPDGWLGLASRWLAGQPTPDNQVRVAVGAVEFALGLDEVEAFLASARAAATQHCRMVAGDTGERVRAVNVRTGAMVPSVGLAAGGPQAGDEELLAAYHELVDLVRHAAGDELGYGFVSFDPTFAPLYRDADMTEWNVTVGPQPSTTMMLLCDEMVFDGFAYQVLAPGHLSRLDGLWDPSLGRQLPHGRVEVEVGDPAQWLLPADVHLTHYRPGPWPGLTWRRRDPQAQLAARGLLAPCLLTSNEAGLLLDRYWGKL